MPQTSGGYDLTQTGTVDWVLTDNLGSVRDMAVYNATTGTTSVAMHRVYDSFGNLVSQTNPLVSLGVAAVDCLFGYTGKAFDKATGLQNNLNRWFDPRSAPGWRGSGSGGREPVPVRGERTDGWDGFEGIAYGIRVEKT